MSRDLYVLAVDPGTRTGWALGNGERLEGGGVHDLRRHAGDHAALLRAWRDWLRHRLLLERVAVLLLEDPPTRLPSGTAAQLLLGMRALALVEAADLELLVELVPPPRWQAWARREAGWSRERKGDEADALHLLRWWQAVRLPQLRQGP